MNENKLGRMDTPKSHKVDFKTMDIFRDKEDFSE